MFKQNSNQNPKNTQNPFGEFNPNAFNGPYANQYPNQPPYPNQNPYPNQPPYPSQGPYPNQPPYPNQGPAQQFKDNNQSSMYPDMQYERLTYEIKENRRRINNLAKRIAKIENYLRIKDTTEYENIDFPKDEYM